MNKKGFTLVEMLVVVLIISLLMAAYVAYHNKGMDIKRNEQAQAMLIELANAARLHNEMHPDQKIAGGFGDNASYCTGCQNPCWLFEGLNSENTQHEEDIAPYALNPQNWGITTTGSCSSTLNFHGYTFFLCNPNFSGTQPSGCTSDDDDIFALMKGPTSGSDTFVNKDAYIRASDFKICDNYDSDNDTTYTCRD